MTSRLAIRATAGLCLLGALGCATTKDPRQQLLEGTSTNAVYKLEPAKLADTVRHLLTEQQYELLPTSDPLYIKTTWRIDGALDMGGSWSRMLVQLVPLGDGRTAVRAYRMGYTTTGMAPSHPGLAANQKDTGKSEGGVTGSYVSGEPMSPAKPSVIRAADFEWTLLNRADPRLGAHLEARADDYIAHGDLDPSAPTEE
ncbi:hypothetical protein LZ198_13195 [Myxococcus sp. K15C18031901]|uniref:hypothetical protein n=1 Tax=Myxococcus dinghuensis TaxID=2906761 RepID=UPI0020A834C3|nr:hypothetical protein [Myxococcus dinghuensis]MCP3099824.1 hypothetical protein [Myxococcus dinghuensis]